MMIAAAVTAKLLPARESVEPAAAGTATARAGVEAAP